MKMFLPAFHSLAFALAVVLSLPALAASSIPGEVDCSKGGSIDKVQALVKKAVEGYKKDKTGVVKEVTAGDAKWKDGEFYVFIYEEGKVIAHGFNASMVGRDLASVKDADQVPYVDSLRRMAMEKGQGCIKYKFPNPAKGGQVEDKVGYVMKGDGKVWLGSGTYFVK